MHKRLSGSASGRLIREILAKMNALHSHITVGKYFRSEIQCENRNQPNLLDRS